MTCSSCTQLPLHVDGTDARIYTQMLNPHSIILVQLVDLDNRRNPDIVTLKKESGDLFSQCCIEIFKGKSLRYVNEVLFEMVKTALKDTYVGGTTTTTL